MGLAPQKSLEVHDAQTGISGFRLQEMRSNEFNKV